MTKPWTEEQKKRHSEKMKKLYEEGKKMGFQKGHEPYERYSKKK